MSRFNIYAVYNDPTSGELAEDQDCFLGWDHGMNTFFFASGNVADALSETPLIWIGTKNSEHPDLDDFLIILGRIIKSPDIDDLYEELAQKDTRQD